MGTTTVTDSLTVVPSGYTGLTSLTTTTSYPVTNGYTGSSSSTYARFTLSSGATGYLYYTFDCSSIPSGATITSITGTVAARVSSTSRVTSTQCQLYTGTTAKGSNTTFASTSSSNNVTLTPGSSWTRAELDDLRLKIGGTGSSSSGGGGSSRYIYFSGASITISYSYSETTYDITITNNAGVTTIPASGSSVVSGETYTLEIYNEGADISVSDNGIDVTAQLVVTQPASGGTKTYTPASYTYSSLNSTSYCGYCIGYSAESPYSSTSNIYSSGSGTTGYTDYSFGINESDFPSNSTITAVTCAVTGHCESTSQSSEMSRVQLYVDGAASGNYEDFGSTSNTTVNLTAGTVALSDVDAITLRHSVGYYGGLVNGATLSITYTVPSSGNTYLTYTMIVTADHVIIINASGTAVIWAKTASSSWSSYSRAWVKTASGWVEQTDLTSVFDTNTNYVRGGQ